MEATMGSNDETATESTHDETLNKIHHQLVLYVKEKEQIDELRHTQAKLVEATESLGKQISEIEMNIKIETDHAVRIVVLLTTHDSSTYGDTRINRGKCQQQLKVLNRK